MKKFYFLAIIISSSIISFAQMPLDWNAILPSNFDTNPPVRDSIKVKKLAVGEMDVYPELVYLWLSIEPYFINKVDYCQICEVDGEPTQTNSEFTGKYAVLADTDYLYVVFNVTDDNFKQDGADNCEIVFSSRAGAYPIDPSDMKPDVGSGGWSPADQKYMGAKYSSFTTYQIHDMFRYCLWADDGAQKIGPINATDNNMLTPTSWNFDKFLPDSIVDGSPSTSSVTSAITPTSVETKDIIGDKGYYQLVKIPWELINNDTLQNFGDDMSIAVRLQDKNESSGIDYFYWGGASNGDVYWAINYYGAVATLSPIPVVSVSLDNKSISIDDDETFQLTEAVNPDNATNDTVTWSSSDEYVATVSQTGLVTAVASGMAEITVTTADGNKIDICTVNVNFVSVTNITLDKDNISIGIGNTSQLTETLEPVDATNKLVAWNSTNPAVASVNSSGLITAKSLGTAKINAVTADGRKEASCSVTVTEATSITHNSNNKQSISIYPNPSSSITETTIVLVGYDNVKDINVNVIDISGKVVYSNSYNSVEKIIIPTNKLDSGTYFIKVSDNNGSIIKKLIVK